MVPNCGTVAAVPAETLFDKLADLFARDVDPSLIRTGLARTPTERLRWLEQMQDFAEAARKARTK